MANKSIYLGYKLKLHLNEINKYGTLWILTNLSRLTWDDQDYEVCQGEGDGGTDLGTYPSEYPGGGNFFTKILW